MSPSSATTIDASDEMQDIMYTKRGCCFWIPCFGSNTSITKSSSHELCWWVRVQPLEKNKSWWFKGWMKIREWSEIMAGPRWKTFIRRFKKSRFSKRSFQYDPLSYALNFDEGKGQKEDDGYNYADFSSRYASLPSSTKSSMDLGKDVPSFM